MSSIEGLDRLEKEGWELVRVGTPLKGVDWIVNADGQAAPCNFETTLLNWLIIRKKPKQYRAFANKAEFAPHRDRWVVSKHAVNATFSSCKIDAFDDSGVIFGGGAPRMSHTKRR